MATLCGMTWIPKIAGLAMGIVIALWMMAYWDVRQANVVCDSSQDPNSECHEGFIGLDRVKQIQQSTERRLAR
jgi:hypothetical protein